MRRFALISGAAAVLLVAMAGRAQFAEKKTLTLDGAEKVIAAAKAEAKKLNSPGGVIAVVDDGGNLMALARLDGTFAAGANISIGKARTAALFNKPTKFFEDVIKNGRTSMVALNDFTPLQGGIPIIVGGQLVGAVGVSGAASAAQDEELAIAGANAFSSSQTSSSQTPVRFFPAKEVDQAFVKGAVLLDGHDTNYAVHASRRDTAGQVEIHTQDTDVIHVLDGKATFITGGKVVNANTVAPNEIRGASVEGGETTHLAKGDVIVVPAGTPHWFKEVQGPLLYYVVKVR
jgi:glc operon protein GlcG